MSAAHAPESLLDHAAFVRAVARAVLGPDDLVDDVVQETWIVALERSESRRGALRPWLGGIARRTALSLRRRRARAHRRDRVGARAESTAAVDDLAARAEAGRAVVDAVLALAEPYRTVILLRYYDDARPREIAERLDVPLETVRTRLRRGVRRLREALVPGDENEQCARRAALLPLALGPRGSRTLPPSLLTSIAGGFLMTKKALAFAALTLLLLGGALVFRLWGVDRGAERTSGEGSAAHADREAAPPEGNDGAHLAGRPSSARTGERSRWPAPVDFAAVDRDRDLHGRVLGPDGGPLGGARVQVVYHPWRDSGLLVEPRLHGETVEGPAVLTAHDGSFRVALSLADVVYLRVTAEGLAPLERVRLGAGERVEIRMRPGVTLLVRARTSDGAPAVDVGIRIRPDARASECTFEHLERTDADGLARFAGLVPRAAVRLVVLPRLEGQGCAYTAALELPDEGELTHELVVEAGWTVTGRVTDAATGRPVAGARVAPLWNFLGAVETDAEGRYALPGITASRFNSLHAAAEGYARSVVVVGSARELDVGLVRGHGVAGRLVDDAGAPVAGARLRVIGTRPLRLSQDLSLASGLSDAEGRFQIEGLARDIPHALAIKARGYGKTIVDFDPPPVGDTLVSLGDVVLPAPCRIGGRVLDDEGHPVPRARVEVRGWNPDRGARRGEGARPVTTAYGTIEMRQSDDLGRFAFKDLAPATYSVMVKGADAEPIALEVVVATEQPGARVELRLPGERRVRIRVLTDAHEPFEGATVQAYDRRSAIGTGESGPDGAVVLVLPPRDTNVYVHPPEDGDYSSAGPIPLAADAEEIDVVLQPGLILTGRLSGPAGRPLHLAVVTIRRGSQELAERTTDAEGRFAMRRPPGGPVTLEFDGRFRDARRFGRYHSRALRAVLEGVPSDAKDVVLEARSVPTDRSLAVRVLDPSGRPVVGQRVTPWPACKEPETKSVETDADGWARFEGLPAIPFWVYVGHVPTLERPWVSPRKTTAVPAGQEVVLRFREGRLIEGTVLAEEDMRERVYVYAELPQTNARAAWSRLDEAGAFSLIVDPDEGPYRLRAQVYGDRGEKLEVVEDGVPAGASGIRLRLAR